MFSTCSGWTILNLAQPAGTWLVTLEAASSNAKCDNRAAPSRLSQLTSCNINKLFSFYLRIYLLILPHYLLYILRPVGQSSLPRRDSTPEPPASLKGCGLSGAQPRDVISLQPVNITEAYNLHDMQPGWQAGAYA